MEKQLPYEASPQPLRVFRDVHTHGRTGPDMVTSVEPQEGMDGGFGSAWYSVGIHPWSLAATPSEADIEARLDEVARLAADPRVVAVGECGFDRRRGGPGQRQLDVFLRHVEIAEAAGKPLIIHCVGRYGLLLDLHRRLRPQQLWLVHGFTGKPELARQLTAAGIAISLGPRSSPLLAEVIPPRFLYRESDDSVQEP